MKIKERALSYEEVIALPKEKRLKPKHQSILIRYLLKLLSKSDLKATNFKFDCENMDKLGKNERALFLMNHSSFIDLKIASTILYPRPFNIICTSDGFVAKKRFMYTLGCIPTQKFVTDVSLVKDIIYTVNKLKSSILMYPEASYSFDGTATPLPESVGKLLKILNIPVVMIKTSGAFLRDPLYNMLQLRKVNVKASMRYILSPDDIKEKSIEELNSILKNEFTFDNFREQQENNIIINEGFRADGLHRVLYKCPCCMTEGKMEGKGINLSCKNCGKTWELTENGFLKAEDGKDIFNHIPDWYSWERECVRKEIENKTYRLDIPVLIRMLVDTKAIYTVGKGRLIHDINGFKLTGCDGKLNYTQKAIASYSLYSDYFWYELGDMICIGDNHTLYYCFPESAGDVVAKTRLATEELYKMNSVEKKNKN